MADYKRIVICCDGTWKRSDGGVFEVPSNVTRLARAIKPEATVKGKAVQQIVYYQSGVGTGLSKWDQMWGGATGDGLAENVREAYSFLANNFQTGDEIVLIGFSRGAYTARAICGLINRLGILTRLGMDHFYQIFAEYRDKTKPIPQETLDKLDDPSFFHQRSSYVTAIACFDTVGSLGIPGSMWKSFNAKYEFRDTNINNGLVGYAFHALALDEQRESFVPTMWEVAPLDQKMAAKALRKPTVVRQCWFPGVHTNVGGGYNDQEIADITLAWMVEQLETVGGALEFCPHYLNCIVKNKDGHSSGEWAEGTIYNSVTGIFHLSGTVARAIGKYGKPGTEAMGECIHPSVRVRRDVSAGVAKADPKKKPWICPSLDGWECEKFDDGWAWVKRNKQGDVEAVLKEEKLGKMEKKLASKRVIEKYFGPEEWDIDDAEMAEMEQECHGQDNGRCTTAGANDMAATVNGHEHEHTNGIEKKMAEVNEGFEREVERLAEQTVPIGGGP